MVKTFRNGGILLLFSVTATLVLSGCNGSKGDAEAGKRWYAMHNCAGCHGDKANNGRAKHLAPMNLGFSSFVGILRKPYSPSMPPFPEDKLPEQDAADIYAWLKSQPK